MVPHLLACLRTAEQAHRQAMLLAFDTQGGSDPELQAASGGHPSCVSIKACTLNASLTDV